MMKQREPCSYLIVADGYRGMQDVTNLPQTVHSLDFQFQPFIVTFSNGFINEDTYFLDLSYS